MSRYILYMVMAVVAATVLWACCKDEPQLDPANAQYRQDLTNQVDYGVYVSGEKVFGFDNYEHQLYSRNGTVCRIQTDDGENYIEFSLKSAPQTGKFVNGSMEVAGEMGELAAQSGSVELYIVKMSEDDCWIWCDSKKLGAVIWLR